MHLGQRLAGRDGAPAIAASLLERPMQGCRRTAPSHKLPAIAISTAESAPGAQDPCRPHLAFQSAHSSCKPPSANLRQSLARLLSAAAAMTVEQVGGLPRPTMAACSCLHVRPGRQAAPPATRAGAPAITRQAALQLLPPPPPSVAALSAAATRPALAPSAPPTPSCAPRCASSAPALPATRRPSMRRALSCSPSCSRAGWPTASRRVRAVCSWLQHSTSQLEAFWLAGGRWSAMQA